MATRQPGSVNVLVAHEAIAAAGAAGRRTLLRETGGILLGFRTPDLVVVTRTVVVDDPASSGRTYLRHRRRAQALLTAVRQDTCSVVGYVGEWHTHPADQPPSPTDLRALAETARMAPSVVALLVIGYSEQGPARLHSRVASRKHVMPVAAIDLVDIEHCTLTITEDTTASLEQEAATLLPPSLPENDP
jgi:integrative and conjugative element protein (TIGR02256 family)